MAGILLVRRSTGVFTGTLLVLLGAWGALVPLIGPYFHYAYTPDSAWSYTAGRFWMEILPGACVVAGGLMVLISRLRPVALIGAALAAAGGAWFALGNVLAPLRPGSWSAIGVPIGSAPARVAEQIGLSAGLGVAIVLLAGIALGRLTLVPASVVSAPVPAKTTPGAPEAEKAAAPAPARSGVTGLFRSRRPAAVAKTG